MARFYAMSIEASLFGGVALVRRWGRIGTLGQERIHLFTDEKDALVLFLRILRRKRSRGYRPCRGQGL
ncbi:putative DNA-binding WGR domain protein [Pararhizobium capsulatum DSM 1112]|uniref:DNA-binding WGR domain protein n=2 Tax=Pararhizobium capsulatum TaxID=34014 RepID=A0ABU0BWJ7_9HYPH|nr:putative DNA-binding WGR domain protein [Pararhizobium capsulatum DSM 1112]